MVPEPTDLVLNDSFIYSNDKNITGSISCINNSINKIITKGVANE